METKGPILAESLLSSLIQKCSGICYNKLIDDRITPSACQYSMGLINGLAVYKHAEEAPRLEASKEKLFTLGNEEPVNLSHKP